MKSFMADNTDGRQPTFYAASYLILKKGGDILLLHRENTGWMDGFWGLPAGHIEGTEGVAEAAIREAKEEVGTELSKADITLRHVMHRPSTSGRVYFDFFFTAEIGGKTVSNGEPHKHDEIQWFPIDAMPENTIPYLKRVPERIEKGIFFSEDVTT